MQGYLIPEWQGYGEDDRAAIGARTMRDAVAAETGIDFEEIEVPAFEKRRLEGGILGRSDIIRNTKAALAKFEARQPRKIFTIGGTCASELAPVAYCNAMTRGRLALLWLDAHGDLNTPQSSPSGHFHGMVLRTLLGQGDPQMLQLIPRPLVPGQVILAGVRALDPSELEYIRSEKIVMLEPSDLQTTAVLKAALQRTGFKSLYIHLDLDVLDPGDFAAAQVPVPGGIAMVTLLSIIRTLNAAFTVVGFSVVESTVQKREKAGKIADLVKKSGLLQ
jgi:arginase